jgi:tripartite-type tricarboxylate transporter receptor subunit TctC
MKSVRALCGAVVVAAFVAGIAGAHAQAWPTRPIRVVSPFPAGSASDTTSRVVLGKLQEILGQPMVVENKAGAGGVLGFADVAKADPDGYTLVTSSTSMATGQVLHSHLPYDPLNDFVPVVMFGSQPNVLVASQQSGFKTVADLVAAAKAKPGTLTFASAGVGSTSHMAGERFRLATKIDVRHIPFRENGLAEVMAGRIDYYFIPLAAAASALSTGKLTVLAVSTAKRSLLLPDVPTVAEAGYPAAESDFWVGLSAPAKTPADIVAKLHDATEKALQDPDVKAKMAMLGVEPVLMGGPEFAKFFREDLEATVKLAKEAGIKPTD